MTWEARAQGTASSMPHMVCVCDGDGLYVTDNDNHHIQVFSVTSGMFLLKWGSEGGVHNQLKEPMGIWLENVGDHGNGHIQVYSKNDRTWIRQNEVMTTIQLRLTWSMKPFTKATLIEEPIKEVCHHLDSHSFLHQIPCVPCTLQRSCTLKNQLPATASSAMHTMLRRTHKRPHFHTDILPLMEQ
jgi:hypothetical protein